MVRLRRSVLQRWYSMICVVMLCGMSVSATALAQAAAPEQQGQHPLTVLTYHDIVADASEDAYATSRATLVAHLDYLQTHGYQPISLELLEKVSAKQAQLPEHAVLLSFDDGLISYAQFVAPLLKIYGYPSVLSIVTSWVDGNNIPPEYSGKLLSWQELRLLQQSPLVSIVSHSHDLHHGVSSNPQGNEAAAGTTRIYSTNSKTYESEDQFRQRIAKDLQTTVQRFNQELHFTPTAITWPYGRYDAVTESEAARLGMKLQFTLDDGPTTTDSLPRVKRMIMTNLSVEHFAAELHYQRVENFKNYFVEVRLDPFIGKTAEVQEQLLSTLLDNLQRLNVNGVVIHAFDRNAKQAFFPTKDVELATDSLNRVAHQIKTRLPVEKILLALPAASKRVLSMATMTDLSRLVWFNGVVFDGQSDTEMKAIKDIARFYHPGVHFGQATTLDTMASNAQSGMDFQFVTIMANQGDAVTRQQLLASQSSSGRVLVSVEIAEQNATDVAKIFNMLESSGVRHYGFAYSEQLYGIKHQSTMTHERAEDALAVFGGLL